MSNSTAPVSYKGFRFPQEIIAHAVWLYYRFNLSYCDIEELLAARGVVVRNWGSGHGVKLLRMRPCCALGTFSCLSC